MRMDLKLNTHQIFFDIMESLDSGYVWNEIKKKTGVNIDGNGNKIIKNEPKVKQETDYNSMVFNHQFKIWR